jgi:hypothetical protein
MEPNITTKARRITRALNRIPPGRDWIVYFDTNGHEIHSDEPNCVICPSQKDIHGATAFLKHSGERWTYANVQERLNQSHGPIVTGEV